MPSILPFKDRDRAAADEGTVYPQLERHHLERLLEQAPAAIGVLTGPEHRWTYVNQSYLQVTGRSSAADFLGKTIRESLPELEGQGFFELLDEVYRKGIPFIGTEMKVRLDRSTTGQPENAYFNFVYQPTRDVSGQVEGILVHAADVTHQVMARRAVELSEERLRMAQAAAQIGTWEWDTANNTRQFSAELHCLFGTDPSDPEGTQKWISRVHPDDQQRVRQLMEESTQTGRMEFEYRYQHPELGLRCFYCKGSRLGDESRMFGVVVDITRRKQAEEALRQSEEEFRGLANAIPQLVWMADPQGWIFWYNQGWFNYTGTTPKEMEGWGWQSVHDPAVLPTVLERWKASISCGEPFEMTLPLRGADGIFRPFLTRIVPIRDKQGKITRWFGTNTDVGVEVRTREEMQSSQDRLQVALVASQRLAAIVESSDDAIASKDLNGIITSWNRSAEKLFGYKAEEIIGKSVTLIIPPELHHDEHMILSKMRRGEKIEHFETIRLHKNGDKIEVSLTISPVKDENGKVIGAAKIIRNITENNKIERALRMTEKLAAAGRMAATVAHEINNPLEAVTNLVYLAKRDLVKNDRVAGYLEMAGRELDRVAHITRQTLGFYRDTSSPVRLNVTETLDDLLLLYEKRFESRKIKVGRQYNREVEITALAGELRQAFSNLITNAIDAMPGGGSLCLKVSKSHEWKSSHLPGVRVTVLDTGSGIEPRHRKNIFQPFFTTKADVGTGLGLWITRGIVEKHGGAIHVKSRTGGNDHGTAFSIFLPMEYAGNGPEKSSVLDMPSNVTSTGKVPQ